MGGTIRGDGERDGGGGKGRGSASTHVRSPPTFQPRLRLWVCKTTTLTVNNLTLTRDLDFQFPVSNAMTRTSANNQSPLVQKIEWKRTNEHDRSHYLSRECDQ